MKIGFIGCGNMGSALASAVCRGEGVSVLAYDVDAAKVEALVEAIGATAAMPDDICREADFVFLAVKPNMIATVLMPLADTLAKNENAVLVSMAAGVKLDTLRGLLKENTPVIRIMPNTSVAIGAGIKVF